MNLLCALVMVIAPLKVLVAQGTDCVTVDEAETFDTEYYHVACTWPGLDTPDPTANYQNFPNLVFRLNFHFLRFSDGSGAYAGDLTSAVEATVADLNARYSQIQPPVMPVPGVDYIDDSRIRFVNEGIYYIDNTFWRNSYYNNPYIASGGTNCTIDLLNQFGVDQEHVYNIFSTNQVLR